MEEALTIRVPDGPALEARLAPLANPKGGFVVCHPHPLYGGDLDNPVVIRAAEVAQAAGYATLRFNFRGAGTSEGVHDKGRGEQEDVRAAMAALATHLPAGSRVGVMGYSFGAAMAARATRPSVLEAPLGLIAPPLGMYDFDFLQTSPGRLLLVAGTADAYCPVEALHRLAAITSAEERIVEGADHFFFGKLYPLGEVIGAWLAGAPPAR
ncbi:MAG TPA: alpha/beta fold hydrolase [Candidatus Acidoferrum sp.]|nr:alpha/beta fold hydrolase [Candidatus Acidoferrum sp.]